MHTKLPITAIVSTKDEESAIATCLLALDAFSEVIVVDSHSVDNTSEIANSLGVRVVDFAWDGKYPKKKQWILDHIPTKNSWIFFIDADERPTPALINELITFDFENSVSVTAFDIPLEYVFQGRTLRHGHRVVKRCLIHREHVRFPEFSDLGFPGMGELEGHYQPTSDGLVRRTRSHLRHEDPDPISSWITRHNKYSDWEAYLKSDRATSERVRMSRSTQGRVFEQAPFKPAAFFVYSYIARLGFLDGRQGLDYSIALSWYYWLTRVKVRELGRGSQRGQSGSAA